MGSASKLMLDELKQEGEAVQFQDVLERDRVWKCIECEMTYSKDTIFCSMCKCFRPIQMYRNLVHRPDQVTDFELAQLDQRRKKEKQLILDLDVQDEEGEARDGKQDKDKVE